MRNILSRICDRWSLLVFYLIERSERGSLRFSELRQHMPDISPKMLSTTLRTLEEDGYISRTVFPEVPPRVEYALTERAESLKPVLDSMLEWGARNMDAIMRDRKNAHAPAVPDNGSN